MKRILFSIITLSIMALISCGDDDIQTEKDFNFEIESSEAIYNNEYKQIELSLNVKGTAGQTIPIPAGQLDGAPVLGYVFPTTLNSNDVGFGNTEGIVAMALTSHPDFDDTPLWDENTDGDYLNDGQEWHAHWVILVDDERVEGGLSVKQFDPDNSDITLPPTNPGMPMYMDSPGFQVITSGSTITVVIPSSFINDKKNFNYDAVSARMKVNTSTSDLPMLGVYEVYSVLSGDLSLPYDVK